MLFTPLSTAYAMTEKRPFRRLLLSCGIALPLMALVMTYSRGCWLAIMVSVVIFVYYADKRLIPVGVVACILLIPFLPDSIITPAFSPPSSTRTTAPANHRLTTWRGILRMIGDYGLTGIGMGPNTFAELYPAYALTGATKGVYHSQMLYLELILEDGRAGLLLLHVVLAAGDKKRRLRPLQGPLERSAPGAHRLRRGLWRHRAGRRVRVYLVFTRACSSAFSSSWG